MSLWDVIGILACMVSVAAFTTAAIFLIVRWSTKFLE